MQSSEQLSQAFTDLAAKLETHTAQIKALQKARRETAQQSDAEIARINAETPDIDLALKNLALLPTGAENDQFMQRLAARRDHLDQVLKTDQEQSQQAHRQITDLEAEERALGQASYEARAKAAQLTAGSQQAKVNQDLLANRLEFSTARQRAADEPGVRAKHWQLPEPCVISPPCNKPRSAVSRSRRPLRRRPKRARWTPCALASGALVMLPPAVRREVNKNDCHQAAGNCSGLSLRGSRRRRGMSHGRYAESKISREVYPELLRYAQDRS